MNEIKLKKGRDISIQRRHPWIFSRALDTSLGKPEDGSVVSILNYKGDYLGKGHYQDGSIAIRVLSYQQEAIDLDFWKRTFINALNYRTSLGLTDSKLTNAYRLIHGEGDGVPGLIIDIYGEHAVVQCHSIGCHKMVKLIGAALDEVYQGRLKTIYNKSQATLPQQYGLDQKDDHLKGSDSETVAIENGISFQINWIEGQKTGFFLDQRDNRKLLGHYSHQKKVLNCFCYTGGFSAYAAMNGAQEVISIDASKKATELALKNVSLNMQEAYHKTITDNVMKFLPECEDSYYDIIVIDPPAFAKNIRKRHNAVQAYKRLNIMALDKVKPGGLVFTFSCSQVVDRPLFYNTVTSAAMETNRKVRVMHHMTQGADHPVNIFHPEGSYLKGLVLYVE